MAIVTISIKDFDDAIKDCKDAYKEADNYSNELNKHIIGKINDYSGDWSSNIRNAYDNVSGKRKQLGKLMTSISNYQNKISTLRNDIVNSEEALATKIESMVNRFCSDHGLRSDKTIFEKFISFLFPGWEYLADVLNLDEFFKRISVSFKNWYRYDGGREIVNLVGAVLAVTIAVIGLALASGFAAIALAVIGLATALVQLGYAIASVVAASKDDPIWARRYETHSENETVQSALRRFGSSNEAFGWAYELATVVDVVNIIASVISIGQSFSSFSKGISKAGDFKNFIKQGFANFKNNLKYFKTRPEVLKDFFFGSKKKTWSTIKTGLSFAKSVLDLGNNLAKGEGASALLTFAGSTIDTITSYMWKMSEKDLLNSYSKEKYTNLKNKNINAKAEFLKTHQDKVLTQTQFDEKMKIEYKIDGFTKYSDMFTKRNEKTDLGSSLSTIKSLAKNGIKLTENIEGWIKIESLSQLDFKNTYDDGTRMEYATWVKDWVKPVTSWEKFIPKVIKV